MVQAMARTSFEATDGAEKEGDRRERQRRSLEILCEEERIQRLAERMRRDPRESAELARERRAHNLAQEVRRNSFGQACAAAIAAFAEEEEEEEAASSSSFSAAPAVAPHTMEPATSATAQAASRVDRVAAAASPSRPAASAAAKADPSEILTDTLDMITVRNIVELRGLTEVPPAVAAVAIAALRLTGCLSKIPEDLGMDGADLWPQVRQIWSKPGHFVNALRRYPYSVDRGQVMESDICDAEEALVEVPPRGDGLEEFHSTAAHLYKWVRAALEYAACSQTIIEAGSASAGVNFAGTAVAPTASEIAAAMTPAPVRPRTGTGCSITSPAFNAPSLTRALAQTPIPTGGASASSTAPATVADRTSREHTSREAAPGELASREHASRVLHVSAAPSAPPASAGPTAPVAPVLPAASAPASGPQEQKPMSSGFSLSWAALPSEDDAPAETVCNGAGSSANADLRVLRDSYNRLQRENLQLHHELKEIAADKGSTAVAQQENSEQLHRLPHPGVSGDTTKPAADRQVATAQAAAYPTPATAPAAASSQVRAHASSGQDVGLPDASPEELQKELETAKKEVRQMRTLESQLKWGMLREEKQTLQEEKLQADQEIMQWRQEQATGMKLYTEQLARETLANDLIESKDFQLFKRECKQADKEEELRRIRDEYEVDCEYAHWRADLAKSVMAERQQQIMQNLDGLQEMKTIQENEKLREKVEIEEERSRDARLTMAHKRNQVLAEKEELMRTLQIMRNCQRLPVGGKSPAGKSIGKSPAKVGRSPLR
eukprot:gnl/TRDRNA2_/TRDRNA2_189185_c0_seq1.p1 gnl/TRDRNA2_/TRDRNA2_189185_c0~~gnl/TRDRNA2_/TRDRNA2_189185_c0_seq1.p1  ORF type:complete len:781 (-),score=176.42 gnl/TRDRNA2_/TRDRNA2_189185_c0_seq1:79-2421(-)